MTADPALYALPQTLRVEECHALDQFLRAHTDQTIQLDGQNVDKLGGLAVQLIVAHQHIRGDALPVVINNPSSALCDAIDGLGLADVITTTEGAK